MDEYEVVTFCFQKDRPPSYIRDESLQSKIIGYEQGRWGRLQLTQQPDEQSDVL